MKTLLIPAALAAILAAGAAVAQDDSSSGSGSGQTGGSSDPGQSSGSGQQDPSALSQQQGATIGDEAACQAVQDRIQASLGQADRGLQSEDYGRVEQWTAIAANYSDVYAAFCG